MKLTLFFSKPYYLKTELEQLIIVSKTEKTEVSRPIEDLGFIVLDHPQLLISYAAIQKLTANNVAIIYCDTKHLPTAMLLPLNGHQTQNERFRHQINASEPLKKQLWAQTIRAKITNQALVFQKYNLEAATLFRKAKEVQSGDVTNREAVAARYYWERIFEPEVEFFQRERYGNPPNNLLNYGYAILRTATARALVGVGLLCTLGIHHHNRYNAFCLADDIMEPYRPFVDELVLQIIMETANPTLTIDLKRQLLSILGEDTQFATSVSPLQLALNKTANSLVKCFMGESKKLVFPKIMK